jgi:hypothetical protein
MSTGLIIGPKIYLHVAWHSCKIEVINLFLFLFLLEKKRKKEKKEPIIAIPEVQKKRHLISLTASILTFGFPIISLNLEH